MSIAKFDTLQNAAGSKSVPVATVVDGSAKAWVNFGGTGTVAIRSSFNVTSVTDNGTGDYTVLFTNTLADSNIALAGMGRRSTAGTNIAQLELAASSGSYGNWGFQVKIFDNAGAQVDAESVMCAAFR
jgi:hypothetical protein